MTTKSHTFWIYLVPVVALLTAALGAVFVHEDEHARDAAEVHEKQLVATVATVIRARLKVPKQDLLFLAQLQEVGQLLGGQLVAQSKVDADFKAFIEAHPEYDQLRILNASGREIVRVNRTPTGARVVPRDELQQKGPRYYFQAAIRMGRGQMYVSPLDLNVEHGAVERPLKPTIRFATPLYNAQGVKSGVLVLNRLAAPMLRDLRQLARSSAGKLWVVNRSGYALFAPNVQDEFGFMFPRGDATSLAVRAPKLWSWLLAHPAASGTVGNAVVTSLRLCGNRSDCKREGVSGEFAAQALPFTASDQPWTIYTEIRPGAFYAHLLDRHYLPLYAVFVMLLLIAALAVRSAWRLSGALHTLRQRERALREGDELFREFAANIPLVSWIREVGSDKILYASPVWKQVTGREPAHALGEMLDYIHPDDRQRVLEAMRASPRGGLDSEFRIVRPDRAERWLHGRTFPIRDDQGKVYRVTGIGEDITHYKEAQERLLQIARYDHLTDLPNRRFFYESLTKILSRAHDSEALVGILSIDLDRFKVVNDSLGHAAGDDVLRQVATRLLGCVRARDIVGRLGGDEFAIALALITCPDDAQVVASKVLDGLAKPFICEGRDVYISGSIGIALYPTDSADLAELLRFADAAMYRAKESGRSTFRYYTNEMNVRAEERLELETGLREALAKNEFELHYQPKLDLSTGAISGAEALLRWNRGGATMASPARFIPLLEETGLIIPVGEWVIREASRQIKAWQTQGLNAVPVAINLSGRQFEEKDLASTVARQLREHDVAAGLLHCEITESLLMSNVEDAVTTLQALRSTGVQMAVDDFGTGYSSLAYLRRFPIDALKIDQSFVRDITTNTDDAAIAMAIIQLAHSLGLKVIAEGVETAEQLQFLWLNRCDEIQGYFFKPPLRAEEFADLLKGHDAEDYRERHLSG